MISNETKLKALQLKYRGSSMIGISDTLGISDEELDKLFDHIQIHEIKSEVMKCISKLAYQDLINIRVDKLTWLPLLKRVEDKYGAINDDAEEDPLFKSIQRYTKQQTRYDAEEAQNYLDNGLPPYLVAKRVRTHRNIIISACKNGTLNMDKWVQSRAKKKNYDEMFSLKLLQRMINQNQNISAIHKATGITEKEYLDAVKRGFLVTQN